MIKEEEINSQYRGIVYQKDQRYYVIRRLGKGDYGEVIEAQNVDNKQKYAIKIITKRFEE